MTFGGFQKSSVIDFPNKISAIVFTKGCNFRCPFCFNRELVLGETPTIKQTEILSFLKKRKKILDGVVITGGEPLLQEDLIEFIKKLKKLRLAVKLDTNGSSPERLEALLEKPLIDYAAIDYKMPLDSYKQAIGIDNFDSALWTKSVKIVMKANIPWELRTTIVPGIHDRKIIVKMAKEIKKIVGKKEVPWLWQNFKPKNCLDREFEKKKPFTKEEVEDLLKTAQKVYANVFLRIS